MSATLEDLIDLLLQRVLLRRRPAGPLPGSFTGVSFSDSVTTPGDLHVNLLRPDRAAPSVREAFERGAVAAIWRHPVGDGGYGPVLDVLDERRALSTAASLLHGHPARGLRAVGITGTNGKTTTAAAVGWGLRRSGIPSGLVCSVCQRVGEETGAPSLTTPDAPELHALLARMRSRHIDTAVIEVTSIGIAQERVFDVDFDVAVCTTLGVDHFDDHGGVEGYARAKRRLFRELSPESVAVFNDDEDGVRSIVEGTPAKRVGVGHAGDVLLDDAAVIVPPATADRLGRDPVSFALRPTLAGQHNRTNLALAAVTLYTLGLDDDAIERSINSFPGIPRRLQVVFDGEFTLVDEGFNLHNMQTTVVPSIRSFRHRARRHLSCWAIRGNRGVRTNRQQAAALAESLRQLGVDQLHLSLSRDTVGDADRVDDLELAAVVDELDRSGISAVVHGELTAAMAAIAGELRPDDLVTLFGAQGMDQGASLLRGHLAASPRWGAAASRFGPALVDDEWKVF